MELLHIADLTLAEIAQLGDSPLAEALAESEHAPARMMFSNKAPGSINTGIESHRSVPE